jgi:hypothetical protein
MRQAAGLSNGVNIKTLINTTMCGNILKPHSEVNSIFIHHSIIRSFTLHFALCILILLPLTYHV